MTTIQNLEILSTFEIDNYAVALLCRAEVSTKSMFSRSRYSMRVALIHGEWFNFGTGERLSPELNELLFDAYRAEVFSMARDVITPHSPSRSL